MLPIFGARIPDAVLQVELVQATAVAPTNATAAYTVSTLGSERQTINGTTTTLNTWKLNNNIGVSDYECRGTLVSGAIDIGTFDTWTPLSASSTWTVQVTSDTGGSQQGVVLVEIRLVANPSVIIDSTVVTITAEVTV